MVALLWACVQAVHGAYVWRMHTTPEGYAFGCSHYIHKLTRNYCWRTCTKGASDRPARVNETDFYCYTLAPDPKPQLPLCPWESEPVNIIKKIFTPSATPAPTSRPCKLRGEVPDWPDSCHYAADKWARETCAHAIHQPCYSKCASEAHEAGWGIAYGAIAAVGAVAIGTGSQLS